MAIAPLKDRCIHGVYHGEKLRTFEVEEDGIKTTHELQNEECWQCKQEEKNRNDAIERQQSSDLRFVKHNLLIALKEDENFREEVKKLLNL
ncbi:MAG: hypothetical protein EKK63_10900 [Acinetobacter sp.]|uniref:hypothetical protein n=1 Tax=Acinetobacter sp. TaxID=472 RepID=UPI000F9916EF|nr:hypothetical protein [Acinetobacter sp.]RUP38874.1 MAG: hypothetical protein EKK63_10900 [Acinetobacter sp.]